jgi:hypothetical protein
MFPKSKMKPFENSTISKIRSYLVFTITIYPLALYRLIKHPYTYAYIYMYMYIFAYMYLLIRLRDFWFPQSRQIVVCKININNVYCFPDFPDDSDIL